MKNLHKNILTIEESSLILIHVKKLHKSEVTITKGLAYMRKRANLKQLELASILKVERSTIAKWESGAAFPRAAQLPELAAALHCTIDELYQPPEESA